jgi:RNA polymerase sigma-70 factor (ECF subfamily)
MNLGDLPTERLLELIKGNSPEALEELFRRYREPLRKMIAARLDTRLQSRIDVSDVIQETLMEANRRIDRYIDEQPIAFYPWLRQIALNRMIDTYRRHLKAEGRDIGRENPQMRNLNEPGIDLVNLLAGSLTSPSEALDRQELRDALHAALDELSDADRELIVMRHIERLSTRETADALHISEGTVKTRLLRALQRLRTQLRRRGYE